MPKESRDRVICSEIGIAMLVAVAINSVLLALTGHLHWPKWKSYVRFAVYVLLSGVAAYLFGAWAYLYVLGYPVVGFVYHLIWCKKHDLDWRNVDTEAYIASQKAWFEKMQARQQEDKG